MRQERKVTAGSGYILLHGYRQLFLLSCSLFLSFSSSSSFPLPCSSIFLFGLWKGGQRYNAPLGHGGLCGINALCLGQQSRARGGVWNMDDSGECWTTLYFYVLTSCSVRTVSPGLDVFLFQVTEASPQPKMFLKA